MRPICLSGMSLEYRRDLAFAFFEGPLHHASAARPRQRQAEASLRPGGPSTRRHEQRGVGCKRELAAYRREEQNALIVQAKF